MLLTGLKEIWWAILRITMLVDTAVAFLFGVVILLIHGFGSKGKKLKIIYAMPLLAAVYGLVMGFILGAIPAICISAIFIYKPFPMSSSLAIGIGAALGGYIFLLNTGLLQLSAGVRVASVLEKFYSRRNKRSTK
mmetsp:Transcript_675/g.2249  ORF Transcript_675/g.2249 Transcript_675/m.2249 type:complete len:135 (+) Transcript_675:165-569(+)